MSDSRKTLFKRRLRQVLAVACEHSLIVRGDQDFMRRPVNEVLEMEIEGLRYAGEDGLKPFVFRERRPAMSVAGALWQAVIGGLGPAQQFEWFFAEREIWSRATVEDVFRIDEAEDTAALERARGVGPDQEPKSRLGFSHRSLDASGEIAAYEKGQDSRIARSARAFYLSGGPTVSARDILRRLEAMSAEAGISGWMITRQMLRNGMEKVRIGKGMLIVVERSGPDDIGGAGPIGHLCAWASEQGMSTFGLNRNRDPHPAWLPRSIANALDRRLGGLSDDPRFIMRTRFWEEMRATNTEMRRETIERMIGLCREAVENGEI